MTRLFLALALACCSHQAAAVNVVIDYTFDSSGFFSTETASGQAARNTVEFAAEYYSELLTDTLSPIVTPDDFASGTFDGVFSWQWQQTFFNPSNGESTTLVDSTIAADEYRIFVGARPLSGTGLGLGGPGGFGFSANPVINRFTQADINQINQITDEFSDAVTSRGETSGFARWGGSISYNDQVVWNFGLGEPTSSNQNDFLSVTLHEIGHVFGFGTSDEFQAVSVGTSFTGANAREANGGVNPQVTGDAAHWAQGSTSSTILGTDIQQTALLEPVLQSGRQLLTELDVAALADIGWEIALPGDYTGDGVVDAADYTTWRDSLSTSSVIGNYDVWAASYGIQSAGTFLAGLQSSAAAVPEPSAALLAAAALVAGVRRR